MSSTTDDARDEYEAAFNNYMGLHDAWVTLTHADDPQARGRLAAKADIAHQELRAALDAYRDALVARAREEGAREAPTKLRDFVIGCAAREIITVSRAAELLDLPNDDADELVGWAHAEMSGTALRWTGENVAQVWEFAGGNDRVFIGSGGDPDLTNFVEVSTPAGKKRARVGDLLVREADGSLGVHEARP